jgi:multiple sugar transport system permease protein
MIKTSTSNEAGFSRVRATGFSQAAAMKLVQKFALHLLLVFLLIIMLAPFFWMIGMSLKPDSEATPNALDGLSRDLSTLLGFFWPQKSVEWGNYVTAWTGHFDLRQPQKSFLDSPFTQFYFNSLVTSFVQVIAVLFTSTLAAYAFARMEFYGKNVLFFFLLATLTIPGEATFLPNLVIISNLKLTNTLVALFLPWTASVFSIFLLRQFFMSIPKELYEAGQIDGLGELAYLWRIALPLSSAAVLTSALFSFMGSWNSLLWPLIASPRTPTVQFGLQTFISNGETQTQWNILMAASTISIIPIVILYFFVQRRFIDGIARTGIK